ncbi:nucleotidyltransferase domain-containing protein [Flavobacterium collinsii]|uniref:nucleotidyltransferase domain-containing protein n=1 Tax=Flavobacterium collinsii TaxID=1114861 RepID=UPI003757D64E
MKLDKKVKNEVALFVKEYYPSQYACLISGSYIDGTNKEHSDIDVVIFVKDRNTVFNEMLCYQTLKIQAMIVPVHNIQEILWMDYITSTGAFISMIAKGIILFDQLDFLKYLIPHAKELKEIGCRPLSDHEVYMMRVKITSLLYDLMDTELLNEQLFTITQILDLVTEFKLKINRIWCGKYKIQSLGELDKLFQHQLLESVTEIFGNKNKKPLIDLTTTLLNQHGGILPYYSKANSLTKVFDDYLVIEIDNDSNHDRIRKTIAVLKNFVKRIRSYEINYYFFLSKPVVVNKREQNIYMIIEADKDFINDYLTDRLLFLVKDQHEISKLLFPFQFDPVYKFSTRKIYAKVAPLLRHVSNIITEKSDQILNTSFQIQFSIEIMKTIQKTWFSRDSKSFIDFNQYLLDCWLPISYDDGLSFKTDDLALKKEKILIKFDTMFDNQKKELLELYRDRTKFENLTFTFLKNINYVRDIDNIPVYKSYPVRKSLTKIRTGQWSLYRETLFTIFSIAFIDNRQVSFIPFIMQKMN